MPTTPAPILTADSITRIGDEAKGAVAVNGSHGGLYAAYLAAKLGVAAAIFNDAGVGRDRAGIAGLDYLAALGIPAAAVGHLTARIGDGADMIARGVVTHANALATGLGCRVGTACREAAAALQSVNSVMREPPPALESAFLLIPDSPAVWALELGLGGRPRACRNHCRHGVAWRVVGWPARDRAQMRCTRRSL